MILPQRSLAPRGRAILLGALSLALMLDAIAFTAIGAWPVGGFAGLELLVAILLFRGHMRAGRASELLLLSRGELLLIRTDAAGRRQQRSFPPAWLDARIEERPGRGAELFLLGAGVREPIGASLGEAERRDLARALATALHDLRHPRFDNAVLRPDGVGEVGRKAGAPPLDPAKGRAFGIHYLRGGL